MARSPKQSGAGAHALRQASDLESIALLPEIAVARVGSSAEPLACYDWSKEPDNRPNGSGQIMVGPKPTLRISDTGNVEEYEPEHIEFTEPIDKGRSQLFRPVCPWFVLFAKWRNHAQWQILTPHDLNDIGIPASAVSWHVMVANRKAYNLTLAFEDIVYAEAAIGGAQRDQYGEAQRLIEQPLIGKSDEEYWRKYSEFRNTRIKLTTNQWLIPAREKRFHLGRIQAPVFSDEYGIRLRFVPPAGAVYGPTNLRERIKMLMKEMTDDDRKAEFDPWKKLKILEDDLKPNHCILNSRSAWALKRVGPKQEIRTLPGPQFANIELKKGEHRGVNSLGLIDDFGDGIVTVTLARPDGKPLQACARIVVGPPDLAPDRRHPLTLYDTFDDRAYLADIEGREGYQGHPDHLSKEQARQEVLDLFRRAYGTASLTNVDAMDNRLKKPFAKDLRFAEEMKRAVPGDLPLTHIAREKHRRLASLETLEDMMREQAKRDRDRRVILEPGPANDTDGLFNLPPDDGGQVPQANSFRRMVPVMRGAHFAPMHLTKRQIKVLRQWIDALRPGKA